MHAIGHDFQYLKVHCLIRELSGLPFAFVLTGHYYDDSNFSRFSREKKSSSRKNSNIARMS